MMRGETALTRALVAARGNAQNRSSLEITASNPSRGESHRGVQHSGPQKGLELRGTRVLVELDIAHWQSISLKS